MLQKLTFQLIQTFKKGKTFRKTLPLDYKKGDKHSHRNPHAILLNQKDKMIKQKQFKRISQIERNSLRPFGKFTNKGFIFQKEKIPFYDIPDLQGFQLKPYVDYNAPRLSQKLRNHQQVINQEKIGKISHSSLQLKSVSKKKSLIGKLV